MNTVSCLLLLFVLVIITAQSWGMPAKADSKYQYDVDSQYSYVDVDAVDISLQLQNYGYDCVQNLLRYCYHKSIESQQGHARPGSFFTLLADLIVTKGVGKKADDVIHVTKDGVALPPGAKHKIPDNYVQNPHRKGNYGKPGAFHAPQQWLCVTPTRFYAACHAGVVMDCRC